MTGLLEHLVGAEIAEPVRRHRGMVLHHTEGAHRALVEVDDERFDHADRVGLALATAREIGDPALVAWFTDLTEDAGEPSAEVLATWAELVTTMIHHPERVDAAMITALVAS